MQVLLDKRLSKLYKSWENHKVLYRTWVNWSHVSRSWSFRQRSPVPSHMSYHHCWVFARGQLVQTKVIRIFFLKVQIFSRVRIKLTVPVLYWKIAEAGLPCWIWSINVFSCRPSMIHHCTFCLKVKCVYCKCRKMGSMGPSIAKNLPGA